MDQTPPPTPGRGRTFLLIIGGLLVVWLVIFVGMNVSHYVQMRG